MFQQPLVKAPVKFSDVVACFSEEEWKLLHEWQNELYNNVMKEIHQVLISLGPLIANSVFSLRVKEKEDVCPLKNRSAKRKSTVTVPPSDIHSNSDVSFGLNQDKTQYLLGPVDSDRRESNNCLTTGVIDSNPDFLFGINQENKQYLDEPPHSDRRESSNCLTTEHESGEPIVSVIIKEEGDTGYMGQDETLEHVSDHRGILVRIL
ncbi:zinc finger protein 282-like isoform X2 [Pleurodeles waltl]|uniref:zinc finger protein 282-like isoform X2 n=1 Tax=Pleurodeles waltl TaxID=8319 RepID=UPI00370992DA